MNTVSTASIAGMVFSLIISVGLPIILLIAAKKKTNAKISSFFIGAATFVLFALVLEQILHFAVISATGGDLTGNSIKSNIWLYGIYGGLAAGIFEETGRFVAMRFIMKKNLTKENALMYGIGHGGIEAILVAGLGAVFNIATSLMINAGQLDMMLGTLDETTKAATMETLSQLCTLPSYTFFMSGIERISAIILHIALSYFVYRAVKEKRIGFYGAAVFLHALVNFSAVIANAYLPVIATEAIIFAMSVISAIAAYRMYHSGPSVKEKQ